VQANTLLIHAGDIPVAIYTKGLRDGDVSTFLFVCLFVFFFNAVSSWALPVEWLQVLI